MIKLRPYQVELRNDIYEAWKTHRNVLTVLPTGGGKTVIFADITAAHDGYSMTVAHRQELVGQISMSLAKSGVEHNIITPEPTKRWIMSMHSAEFGRHFYNSKARPQVAGVDTLIKRAHQFKELCRHVTLWTMDEAHHVLQDNKWGKAVKLFPNAKGLGVTATPMRADGKGLGAEADGFFDVLCTGPNLRYLIDSGFLSDYIVYSIPSNINLNGVDTSATGDYNKVKLKKAARKSRIVGDVVKHYMRIASGKLGVTFVTDVETAEDVAAQYRRYGIPAEAVFAKTPGRTRQEIIQKFRNRKLLQLVNVDLFGEGFDLPAIEVVSMARPTQSYVLYSQQFGRGLRLMPGKPHAIIIDHVGNVRNLKLPDYGRAWSLASRDRKSSNGEPPMKPLKVCHNCSAVYEGYSFRCPYCGYVRVPANRSKPEFVDGDLTLLDAQALAELRNEKARIDADPAAVRHRFEAARAPAAAARGAEKRHRERSMAQQMLRDMIAIWAGYRRAEGVPDAESYRMFWHTYGVDVLTAQTLGRPEAELLTKRIQEDINCERIKPVQ